MECVFRYMATKKGKHNCNTNIKYGPDVTAPQILLAKPRENQKIKNLEKTKKPKLFRECLVWGSCLFFFGFPRVFLVFLVMTLKKLKKLKVFFLVFWINWWLKNCEKPKKLRSFLVFRQIFRRHVTTIHAKNQKRPEFFWFFTIL